MKSTITLNQATLDELDELSVLFDQYRVFYGQKSNLEGAKAFLLDRFVHLESVIFAAKDQNSGRLAGFTQLYPTFSSISMRKSWILNDLYVDEQFRGQGAGKMLLKRAADYAVQTGAKGIELSTSISNVTAQRLYESFGFKKDEQYFHYYFSV